jgi:heme exporter protein A
MPDSETALTVSGVSRRFGYRYVLTDVSFEVRGGEVLLLLGHNGAGKSTLIRVLAGLLRPSNGSVDRIGSLGVVAHESMLYESLSARENLQFFGKLYGGCGVERVDELLQTMGLGDHANRRVATYSRGMVQRLTIARALLPDPQLLLLDEPLTGLDDSASSLVRRMLAEWRAQQRAVVLATHQIADIADLASHVGYLVKGRLEVIEPCDGRGADAVTARYRELASDV